VIILTESSSPLVIELKGVKKAFKIGKEVVPLFKKLSFQCKENELIVLTGPSGSGKTTILSIIAGLTRVDQGTVRVYGNDLSEFNEESLAIFRSSTIGIVFQMGHLIETLTILENILLPVELAQFNISDFEERAQQLLNHFYLSHRTKSLPKMISGGEYQRTAFIRALILDPSILLIDEPTANQDKKTKSAILEALSALKGKKTIIIVTHSQEIFPLADRIFVPTETGLSEYNG
jgi:ABC-type lipoprotein export system ATPase subunit